MPRPRAHPDHWRANYAASGAALGLDLTNKPEQLEQPYLAAMSAAEWWHRHGCNGLADTGDMAVLPAASMAG